MRGVLSLALYELTMATSYLRRGVTGPATFSLFVRRLPAQRGFLVSAGLADCLDHLESFQFTAGSFTARSPFSLGHDDLRLSCLKLLAATSCGLVTAQPARRCRGRFPL
jgi:nicotinic acid phosphoribosyltransferase